MTQNEEQISVIGYVNQIKSNTIKSVRLLETDIARAFDEIIEVASELTKHNIVLTKTIENQSKEINNLKGEIESDVH